MNTNSADVSNALATLLSELADGASSDACYVLNRGDAGLLQSLEKLSATAASQPAPTGSTIAAHVDHLRYGFSLMNRWASGDNPWGTADWTASWRKTTVSEPAWRQFASPDDVTAQGYVDEDRAFIDACLGEAPPPVTVDDAFASIATIDAAYTSLRGGGRPEPVSQE